MLAAHLWWLIVVIQSLCFHYTRNVIKSVFLHLKEACRPRFSCLLLQTRTDWESSFKPMLNLQIDRFHFKSVKKVLFDSSVYWTEFLREIKDDSPFHMNFILSGRGIWNDQGQTGQGVLSTLCFQGFVPLKLKSREYWLSDAAPLPAHHEMKTKYKRSSLWERKKKKRL